MAAVSTVTTEWTGFQGSPGYTKMNFLELSSSQLVQSAVDSVRNFWFLIRANLKQDWTLTVKPMVQTFDLNTGDLVNEITAGTAPVIVTGSVVPGAGFAAGVGFQVKWSTGQIMDGRKITGRTFVVPAASAAEFDGTILEATRTAAITAGNALISATGNEFCIWHKRYDNSDPPKYIGGTTHVVSGCDVPDRVSVLKTRRY